MWVYLYSKDAAKMMYQMSEKGVDGRTNCLGSVVAKLLKEYIEIIRNVVNSQAEAGYGDVAYSPQQIMHLCADIEELIKNTGYTLEILLNKE